MKRQLILCLVCTSLAIAAGCSTSDSASSETEPCGQVTPEERAQNQKVFDALSPVCSGCHATGARGYFTSIESFEALVVYDTREVVPGKPDESELVRLLEGHGTRAFKQMPIAGPTYAELAKDGTATMGMAEIRTWVEGVKAREVDTLPSIEAPRVTRISALDLERALYQQLGLSDDDFFIPASNYDVPHKSTGQQDEKYPLSSPDAIPPPFESLPIERFASLGGGSAMFQVKADASLTPSFVGSLTQISQRWCALALDKPNNTALLPAGTDISQGSADAAGLKALLKYWFLHFHAVLADDAQISEVLDTVFVPLESETDARAAYVGTCSHFIRDPHWIFY